MAGHMKITPHWINVLRKDLDSIMPKDLLQFDLLSSVEKDKLIFIFSRIMDLVEELPLEEISTTFSVSLARMPIATLPFQDTRIGSTCIMITLAYSSQTGQLMITPSKPTDTTPEQDHLCAVISPVLRHMWSVLYSRRLVSDTSSSPPSFTEIAATTPA